ncbi:MAG: hypothetical protein AAFQ57_10110 [Cyanobacteria bacterium J06626_14]
MAVVSEAEGVFVANDKGLVVIEAESAPPSKGWEFQNDLDGYTGSGYYRWVDGSRSQNSGIISYDFTVSEDGPHRVSVHALRNGRAEGREVKGDQENDFWVRVNGGEWQKLSFHGPFGDWTWATRLNPAHGESIPAEYNLTAGTHTIEISGRSKNAMFDRIHIAPIWANTDLSEEESNRIFSTPQPPEPPFVSNQIDDVDITENDVTTQIDLYRIFRDIETPDDELIYSVSSNSNTQLVQTDINSAGKLRLSYASGQEGTAEIVVRATDEDGLSVSTSFTVNVDLPEPPVEEPPVEEPPAEEPPAGKNPINENPPVGNPLPPSEPSEILGTSAGDRLVGTMRDDVIRSGGGRDQVSGLSGDDQIIAGGGNDRLRGNAGNDDLMGGAGRDRLNGGNGNDELDGGRGRDIYRGGAGNDIFVIERGPGFDIIQDFRDGDMIRLGNGLRFEQVRANQQGRDTLLSRGNDVLAVVRRFDVADFTSDIIA